MEDKLTLEQFAEQIVPDFEGRWEMYNMTPEELIGKTVVSIRSGFSSMDGGQIMKVESMREFNGNIQIHLEPTLDSLIYDDERETHLGWSCDWDDRYNSFVIYE